MIAIYKDTFYDFPDDKFFYTLQDVSGATLFQGKAYKFPDSESGSVIVNKIAQNYINSDIPDLSTISATTTYTHSGMTGTFNLCGSGDTVLQTFDFINDWNYDDTDYSQNQSLNVPVNDHTDVGMYHFVTNYNKTTKKVSTVISRVTSGNSCGDYALYYTNRKGGIDALLIEGISRETDAFTPYDFERYVTTADRNKKGELVRYMNVIEKSFELHTGWLSDSQSKTLARHLFSSNNVILHNLKTGELMPVALTNADVEYKEFRNERKLNSYQIDVRCANKELLA